MNDDLHWPSLVCGISITCIFWFLLFIVTSTWFPSSTTFYQDGYFEAYKQFRLETLEQDVPRNIKLRFEINFPVSIFTPKIAGL